MTPAVPIMEKGSKFVSLAYAVFLLLWLGVLIFLLVLLSGAGELFYLTQEGKPHISDFLNVYAAGKLTLSADRIHIYDALVQQAMVNQLISPHKLEHTFFLQYPPIFFMVTTPLAFFPMTGAYALWLVFTIGLGITALYLLTRVTGHLKGRMPWIFLAAVLATAPSWRSLRLGQVSWLLVGLAALYCYCLLRRKDIWAGILLAFSSLKLQYLPFLVVPLLAGRRWKAVLSAVVTQVIVLIISALIFGVDNVVNYPKIVLSGETSSQYIGVAQERMVSLIGVVSALGLKHVAGAVSVVGMLAGLILSFMLCRSGKLESPKTAVWPLALTMVIAVLTSPHVHLHDLLLLSIAAAMTLQVMSPFDAWRLENRYLRLWNGIFTLYPIVSWILFFMQGLIAGVGFFIVNAALLMAGLAAWRAGAVSAQGGETQ